jgi:hypothetical protein
MIKLYNRYLSVLFVVGAFLINSCSKPDDIGIEVIGELQDDVFYTDTLTVIAETIREDSLRSDEAVAAFNMMGSYSDPVFGLSRASFYTQILLPSNNNNFTFGTDPLLDSVVFTLAYADYYGDTLTPMNVEVYQTDEKMVIDTNYSTNDVVLLGQQLYSGAVDVRPKDSLTVSGAKRAPHLRLRLNDAFGTSFITSGSANFVDNVTLTNYFKGVHVKAVDVTAVGQGVIMSFNLLASMSKLTFYYKNGTDTTARSASFEINSACSRFNHFEHDYTAAEFGTTFPANGDNRLYIQSMAGVKIRLKFPHLKDFNKNGGPTAINKAELVIPVLDNTTFKNHQNLLVFGVDTAGAEAIIPDLLEPSSYYGGSFVTAENVYKFNLARYVQRVVSGKIAEDYGLSLISSGGAINAYRTIVPGTAVPGAKMQLKITYSKLY